MNFQVYILFSNSINKHYTGYSGDVDTRLAYHNQGLSTYTKKGMPWKIIWKSEFQSKKDALILEKRIKKRGAKRFLLDLDS